MAVTNNLSSKEVYRRLKFKEKMQKEITKAKRVVDAAQKKLDVIYAKCPHYDSFYKNEGNTGGWDYEDTYWRSYQCNDCGQRWQTEQSREFDVKYPYAVDKTYN